MNSGLPPRMMSVPRPAMLVAIVTIPLRPACATISASRLVVLGVQDLVLDPVLLEHVGDQLRLLDRGRADQDRPAGLVDLADLVEDRLVLLVVGPVDHVGVALAGQRPVGRDRDDVELVDLPELVGLGHGRAGHARELLVELEEVLEGDRGEGLVLLLDPDPLLGLDRLVEAVGPLPAGHQAAGELVDDHDLAVHDDVVAVALVEVVGLERVVDQVGPLHVARACRSSRPRRSARPRGCRRR